MVEFRKCFNKEFGPNSFIHIIIVKLPRQTGGGGGGGGGVWVVIESET